MKPCNHEHPISFTPPWSRKPFLFSVSLVSPILYISPERDHKRKSLFSRNDWELHREKLIFLEGEHLVKYLGHYYGWLYPLQSDWASLLVFHFPFKIHSNVLRRGAGACLSTLVLAPDLERGLGSTSAELWLLRTLENWIRLWKLCVSASFPLKQNIFFNL